MMSALMLRIGILAEFKPPAIPLSHRAVDPTA
jgi:hypothetical protein